MRRVVRLAAAVLCLTVLAGADAGGCERRRGVESDRPEEERQVDPRRERVVLIRAEGSGPYTVLVIAQEEGKTGVDRSGPEDVAAGEYRQTLRYTAGLRVTIRMTVRGHSNDRFHCQILDGGNTTFDEAYGQVFCSLTTNR